MGSSADAAGPRFHLNVDAPNQFLALDASGKSATHFHHRRYPKARAGKPPAGFFHLQRCYPRTSFKLSSLFHCIFGNLLTVRKTFDASGNSPANHHRRNHAEPRAEKSAAGFSIGIFYGTPAACHDTSSPNARHLRHRGRAAVRTFEIFVSRRELTGVQRGKKFSFHAPFGFSESGPPSRHQRIDCVPRGENVSENLNWPWCCLTPRD